MKTNEPLVLIIMGSKSDWDTMSAVDMPEGLGIGVEYRVALGAPDRRTSPPQLRQLTRLAAESK